MYCQHAGETLCFSLRQTLFELMVDMLIAEGYREGGKRVRSIMSRWQWPQRAAELGVEWTFVITCSCKSTL